MPTETNKDTDPNGDDLVLVEQIIKINKSGEPFSRSNIKRRAKYPGFPSIIPYDRNLARYLIDKLSREDFIHLLQGLVKYSQQYGPRVSGGSASPVITLHEAFSLRYPEHEPEISDWIAYNRVNQYEPFGTVMHSQARSMAEFDWARAEQEKNAHKSRLKVEAIHEARLARDAVKATENLPNAIKRGDIKAVEALFAKGACADTASHRVGSLYTLAECYGRHDVLHYLKEKGVD